MDFKTADLCDENEFESTLQVSEPVFRDYGGSLSFHGGIKTVKVFEDNTLVRSILETEGQGRVLVVDGGGSTRCSLVGDLVAQLAYENDWSGIVVNGGIRDSVDIAKIPVGLKALGTVPKRSLKEGKGDQDILVYFAGIIYQPGQFIYADEDGIVTSARNLL